MGVFERIKSAAAGAIPVEDDLDMDDSQRVKNLPASADPGDAARADEVPAPAPQFYRQDTLPTGALDGATLVTDADGSGSDTTARYVYNETDGVFELSSAVGPSEPTLGTPVAGALWRDTSDGSGKQYDGSDFVKLTPPTTGQNNIGNRLSDSTNTVSTNGTIPPQTTVERTLTYTGQNDYIDVSFGLDSRADQTAATLKSVTNGSNGNTVSGINQTVPTQFSIYDNFDVLSDAFTVVLDMTNTRTNFDAEVRVNVTPVYVDTTNPHTHPI